MWILSLIMANLCIAVLEYLYRTNNMGMYLVVRVAPLVILTQFCLWYSWRHGPGLMLAWVTFFLGNAGLRIINAHYMLGETISGGQYMGLVLVVGGAFAMHYWRT